MEEIIDPLTGSLIETITLSRDDIERMYVLMQEYFIGVAARHSSATWQKSPG